MEMRILRFYRYSALTSDEKKPRQTNAKLLLIAFPSIGSLNLETAHKRRESSHKRPTVFGKH